MNLINTEITTTDFDTSDFIVHLNIFEYTDINNRAVASNSLTTAKKHVVFLDAGDLIHLNKLALKYIADSFEVSGRVAIAFYSKNMKNILSLLCYKMRYDEVMPFELFTDKTDAIEWLQSKRTSLDVN